MSTPGEITEPGTRHLRTHVTHEVTPEGDVHLTSFVQEVERPYLPVHSRPVAALVAFASTDPGKVAVELSGTPESIAALRAALPVLLREMER
ncbi:hypothetical protein AB0A05_27020 [Streptomyces sp. NPDC046374]|uniref:hypothetical protein n=1 Tax=Streptomyces sp. NPDC046374 TaxID=3154917 RepID=UPI0033EBC6B0